MKGFQHIVIVLIISALANLSLFAQEFQAEIQLRPRYEYRHGYKDFLPDGEKPASFISQRSRVNLSFIQEDLSVYFSAQNISIWGERPIASASDVNGTSIHEAWASYHLNHHFTAKVGRQVISYDNQRIFGGLDWAQQGQSHDAFLLQYNNSNHLLDLGFALNNASESTKREHYTVPNYKAMQYLWYHTQISALQISLLFVNTGYEFEKSDADLKTDYFQTWGTYLNYQKKKLEINAGVYGQTGKSTGKTKKAWYANLDFAYRWNSAFDMRLGYEFLSGKSHSDTGNVDKSFTPLFGTSHSFNGYMDYFYSGNHLNTVGLQDIYLKMSYRQNKWNFGLHPHLFYSAAEIRDKNLQKRNSYLGTELDFTADYQLRKDIKLSGGYSQLFSSKSLEYLKNINNNRSSQWAWIMISIQPTLFKTNKPS